MKHVLKIHRITQKYCSEMTKWCEKHVWRLRTALYQNTHETLLTIPHTGVRDMYHVQLLTKSEQPGGTGTRDLVRWKTDDEFSNR